jgi:SRSO17 transposase
LNFSSWDADAVRDVLRGYVLDRLAEPSGVMVADETGFLKKGTKSAGVQRQYSGTAGRIENCQLGVFLTYVSGRGRALIDWELYLPQSWCADRARCRQAGIGEDVEFATTPELARRMLARAREAGAVFDWFTADEAYGDNPGLRAYLEDQGINYVMAISVRVAGSRWAVEETFPFAKNETGLDHYQVRKYQAWYRHITLSMLAAAFLAVTAHTERIHEEKRAPKPTTNT